MITNYDVGILKAKRREKDVKEEAYAELCKIKKRVSERCRTANRVQRSIQSSCIEGTGFVGWKSTLDCRAKLQALNAGFL